MKKTLQEKRAAYLAEMKAISDAAKLGGRGFTDDERARLDVLRKEDDAAKAQLAKVEADEQLQASIDADLAAATVPVATKAGYGVNEPLAPRITVKDNFEDDPKKGFKDHREFLNGVMSAAIRKGTSDQRLKSLASSNYRQLTAGSDEHGQFSDPYGGFLVPEAFTPNLLTRAVESDPLAGLTTKIPMSAPLVKIPARTDSTHTTSVSGGLRVYRRVETDTAASSRMATELIQIEAHSLFGVAYATEELLERSVISFMALLEAGFADEFAAELLKEKLFGSGVGEFEGVMNSPALVSISKESGQAAATLVYENVLKMRARCWRYSQAVWLANHDTLPQLAKMSLAVGTGGAAVWMPSIVSDRPDMLLGRPLYFTEFCKTLGTTGDIILVNPTQYLEGTYRPMRSAESMHVRFLEHERTMKFWIENDGRGWWRAALTVNQGSNSLSPFVALNTRS